MTETAAKALNALIGGSLSLLRHKGWMQTKQAQDLEAIGRRLVEEGGDPTEEEQALIDAFYNEQVRLLFED